MVGRPLVPVHIVVEPVLPGKLKRFPCVFCLAYKQRVEDLTPGPVVCVGGDVRLSGVAEPREEGWGEG